jgi:hypothetical protein
MLCHPRKLTPPSQSVKYTGLIFNTTTEPKLLVPEDKQMKSLAMIEYAQRHRKQISRLALAVIVGVLESLVEATPTRLGHTYLRHLQHTLHPLGWDGEELPYFSYTSLTYEDLQEFGMWTWILEHNYGRRARAQKSGTLIQDPVRQGITLNAFVWACLLLHACPTMAVCAALRILPHMLISYAKPAPFGPS